MSQWLDVMRAATGIAEVSGEGDNPKILGAAQYIASVYPEMQEYCNQYIHDSIAWCGLAAAYCLTVAGVRPPFGPTDTDKFLWAQSFAHDPGFIQLEYPVFGCIVVMTRSGGGHVSFYESTSGSNYMCRGGNQSDAINLAPFAISSVIALMWPKDVPIPAADWKILRRGDTGQDVAEVQRILGIPVDGDFGSITEGAVKGFQAGKGLNPDGIVGPQTWEGLDHLDTIVKAGSDGLTADQIADILALAQASPLMMYSWRDRGIAPVGYIPGMCLVFGLAMQWSLEGCTIVDAMAQADRNDPDTDVLSWYRAEMTALGWNNSGSGPDTLRHLFALMIGLGMRESSGRYCEGRDLSASNVEPDTAEAGTFQTSWNIKSASPQIPDLAEIYWKDPNGFLEEFQQGITPSGDELQNFGVGAEGTKYQFLSKFCPAFHALVTAVGLRYRRQHWGPVNRKEIELLRDADALLEEVQEVIEVSPEPPQPQPETAEVSITVESSGPVRVTINGVPYG